MIDAPKFMVLRPVFAVLALLFTVSLAYSQSKPAGTVESQQVIESQLQAFRGREHDKAFGFAAPGIRGIFQTTERFIGMVKGQYDPIYRARAWSFGRTKFVSNTLFQEVLISGPDGREWMAIYSLQQQPDGSWKISGVQMVPGAARST